MNTTTEWAKIIRRWESSGKTQKAFCKAENISFWSFRNWKARLAKHKREVDTTTFIEISPEIKTHARSDDFFRIVLPCGIVIEMSLNSDVDKIKTILSVAGAL